ncbi:protease inhibitor I42 family protein [Shewanella surugensis]|uniref:Protease inhibitor I42 family protein n=1 Tax=Shewanella surugensis TaxID=212020 RepID=A0ABT0LDX3_9GAMM|nr:protease inhibitor I42 family protein [Shewanella surugensis]MCL1125903.1 protease inhibitor I42 family protein [Shewanella surugensis]
MSIINKENLYLTVGEPISLLLPGNLSTGYSWYLRVKPDELLLFSAVYATNPHLPGMVGVPGKVEFDFLANATGIDMDLEFVYMRAWETDPVQIMKYKVTINPNKNNM